MKGRKRRVLWEGYYDGHTYRVISAFDENDDCYTIIEVLAFDAMAKESWSQVFPNIACNLREGVLFQALLSTVVLKEKGET